MTIKICHDKTMDNLAKIGKITSKILQLFFLSWIFIGIYWIVVGYEPIAIAFALVFGVMITFLFVPMCRNRFFTEEYTTILHDINNKLKLFEWNRDC